MNFLHLFTSLDGRIGRAKWWVGTLILFVSARLLAGIIAGFFAPPTGSVLITIVYLALFRPGYAVSAKRFQDRDKPGVTALYGLIPGLIAVLLPVYGLHGSWQQPNTLGWICAFIEWAVSIWFVIELGILKGSTGRNRFDDQRLDVVAKSQALDGSKIIGGRLAAYFAAAAGAAIMAALCNTVVWMISVPQTVSLFALLHSTDRGAEPDMLTKATVLLLASGFALIWFVLATPFARLALRVWPVDPFGGWTVRNIVILAFSIVCLVPVVLFFFLTFVGVMNWYMRFAIEGWTLEPRMFGSPDESMLQNAVVRLGWSSIVLGAFCIFCWAHLRAAQNIRKPFAVFLRRFSGFADRALVVSIIKSMPKGVPLAFVASRADQARNWDPFVWAFGGLRVLRPLKNLPIQIETTDKDWMDTVGQLMRNAKCVIIDLSEKSPSVELERQLIDRNVSHDRIVAVVDARKVGDDPSDQLLARAVRYSPSFLSSAVPCLVKVGIVFAIWMANKESIWGWLALLVLPFLIMPSVSSAEKSAIREAVRTAMHR